MSIAEANLELPSNFTGVVKVFPLPNLVLFPGVIQPLHIFEPRYRKMLQDALNSDQLIAIAKLADDRETGGDNPEIHQTVCIGKIVTHAELPDGGYHLLLLGARRANIIRELPSDLPYRLADVQVLEKVPSASFGHQGPIRKQILGLFEELTNANSDLDRESISHLLSDDLPFGLLMDLVSFSCGACLEDQQRILESSNVLDRANMVIEVMQDLLTTFRQKKALRFPPRFSYN